MKKQTIELIKKLKLKHKKSKKKIWLYIIKMLGKSSRQRKKVAVNLSKLEKLNNKFKNKIFIVPGKVLGTGKINEKITVSANEFSKTALRKLNEKGKALTIESLLNENIKENRLMIIR